MRNGTQEELDAAKDDARLLPVDAVFVTKEDLSGVRIAVMREVNLDNDDMDSVYFTEAYGDTCFMFLSASDLEVVQ